mmetsp:Transcript_7663/g.16725  ORF Transcript_7663/g.16725 Transcript_7663/m.16725 type:complete len:200 (+) Transcript_7663:540-1139(+)
MIWWSSWTHRWHWPLRCRSRWTQSKRSTRPPSARTRPSWCCARKIAWRWRTCTRTWRRLCFCFRSRSWRTRTRLSRRRQTCWQSCAYRRQRWWSWLRRRKRWLRGPANRRRRWSAWPFTRAGWSSRTRPPLLACWTTPPPWSAPPRPSLRPRRSRMTRWCRGTRGWRRRARRHKSSAGRCWHRLLCRASNCCSCARSTR